MMKKYALIVAGGAGKRMGTKIPKQFLLLSGLPVLMHTIRAFYTSPEKTHIILVLPETMITYWKDLCKEFGFSVPHQIAVGGATRYGSVKNGLKQIRESRALVAIHDGVRPLVAPEIISASFKSAHRYGTGITAVNLRESLRSIKGDRSVALNRSDYRLVQTPQTFQFDLIRDAYDLKEDPLLTDDAVVAEKAGVAIHLVDGSYENIKITTKSDLLIAEAIMNARNKKSGM